MILRTLGALVVLVALACLLGLLVAAMWAGVKIPQDK